MIDKDIVYLLKRWAAMQRAADRLSQQIRDEIISSHQTVKTAEAVASYSAGRGTYDYEAIAVDLDTSDADIQEHTDTHTVTNWKQLVEDTVEDAQKRYRDTAFYVPGTPGVRLKLTT